MKYIIKNISLWKKLYIDLISLMLILLLLLYSIFMIWSASNQNIDILQQKILQIVIGLLLMFLLAQIPPRIYEFWAPHIYNLSLALLIFVNFIGKISKGAQRWIDIGFIRFQPSELIKISILLMAAYYINQRQCPPNPKNIFIILLLTIIPTALTLIQPDLGTAIIIFSGGLFILFLSGINWKLMMMLLSILIVFIPIFWCFCMHEYQRNRIEVLLHPEVDPLGSGYHIIQSKIAIGSGGLTGKGWLQGTQSQLEFLPERHTDFIFSVIGEELGFLGISVLLILYISLILRGFFIAIKTRNMFGRLFIGSFTLILFMHVFINISMVSGLLPIVGIPLPLISHGGSSLLILMSGFGIAMSIHGHRKMISQIL